MTDVTVKRNHNDVEMLIDGHAGYGAANGLPEGCDIVCASISLTAYTAIQRMREMENEGKLIALVISCHPGRVQICIQAKSRYIPELYVTVKTIETAFWLLEDRYPNHVRVNGVGEQSQEI